MIDNEGFKISDQAKPHFVISYDKNGNIQSLDRKGHIVPKPFQANSGDFGLMDRLAYQYDSGNKLLNVSDTGTTETGFRDGNITQSTSESLRDYSYDENGNMTIDRNKGIEAIKYNHLNLPTRININGNGNIGTIEYVYDATGLKLQKQVSGTDNGNAVNTTTQYAGNHIYENGELQFFNHAEGYVTPNGVNGYDYIYQYKDHLGNVRLTYADADLNGSIEPNTEIISEKNYYPFGLLHRGYNNVINGVDNNYKQYQGQEYTEDLGLNTHEWRYRVSDPAIGRFWQVDPLAEDYVYNGVYNFSENRVIDAVELEGLESVTLYELQKLFSPIAINFSGSYGTEKKGIGVNISIGAPQILPYSERREYGASYYADDILQSNPVVETRSGREQSIFGLISKKTTTFNSGETSQTLGEIRLGGPLVNLKTSNDVGGLGDGGDRFRTAALEVNFFGASAGFNVGTGDPGMDLGVDRKVDQTIGGPFGTYVTNSEGKNPDKYRLGLGYLGIGPFKAGVNSEKLRAGIQNNFHRLIGSPDFKVDTNFKDKPYFEFSFGGSTIWE